jgi:starvation-inducible outer membrane lipoprotein
MRPRCLIVSLCLALAGCATSPRTSDRDAAAEARGYERGYRQAVKEQYWIIQNQQRGPSAPAANDNLNPRQP